MTQKNLQCNEKMFYLCTLKHKALQRVKVFLGYCTDFQLQIPERLPTKPAKTAGFFIVNYLRYEQTTSRRQ